MEIRKLSDNISVQAPYTALLYCPPGVGKSTTIGLIAERSKGKTLILDVDRTVDKTLAKGEIVKDISRIDTVKIDTANTFDDWTRTIAELNMMKESGNFEYTTIAVDNISELERGILSDLGFKGKNKGVPCQGDYQTMQFKLVNSLRFMKTWGCNIVWTAWEDARSIVYPDGTSYSQICPKISAKIVDNICGLCDVVGKIMAKQDGTRGIILEATANIYAKNQIDSRKGCLVEDFTNFNVKENGV